MPWPVTHILTAELMFNPYFSHLNHQAFIIGTCFPDIRYPAGVDRNLTHINHIPFDQIKDQPAFRAGLVVHNLTDDLWNAYIRQHSDPLFSIVPHDRPMFHTLKILQDRYLYSRLDQWDSMAAFFESLLPEELTFGIETTLVEQWHAMLGAYLSKPPVQADLQILSETLPAEVVTAIEGYYTTYRDDAVIQQILVGFYAEFNKLIAQSLE